MTSLSQTVLKQMPPGITPPLILNYNASDSADSGTWPFEPRAARTGHLRPRPEFHSTFARFGAGHGHPIALRRQGTADFLQIDLDPQKLEADNLSGEDLENALAAQNQIIPAGTIKVGSFEYNVKLNNAPTSLTI